MRATPPVRSKRGAVHTGTDLTVANESAAKIIGTIYGVYGTGVGTTVTNAGIIAAGSYDPATGTVTVGGDTAIRLENGGTITNQAGGTIEADGYAIRSLAATTLTNEAGATIVGSNAGAAFFGDSTVANAGTISSTQGVALYGDTVLGLGNAAGGTVQGVVGVLLNASGTVYNAGTITGTSFTAVSSNGGLVLSNTAGGVIGGVTAGVTAVHNAAVLNAGSITSDQTSAIAGGAGLSVTNTSTGTLTGGTDPTQSYAIEFDGVGTTGTFDNYGTATGTSGGVSVFDASSNAIINLYAGSTTGNILLNDGNDTVTLYTGVASAAAVTGTDPATTLQTTLRAAGTYGQAVHGAINLGGGTNALNLAGTGTGTPATGAAGTLDLGTVTGAYSIQKGEVGTWTLTGTGASSGATTITAGTLLVNGSIAGSAITVQSGGTLGGSGTTGAVTVQSGGFLSPGNSPGIISTGNLALANGAAYVEQIGGTTAGTGYDQTNVTGTVNLNSGGAAGGGATLSATFIGPFTPTQGQTYVIIANDGNDAVQGTFAGLAEGATVTVGGVNLVISYRGGDGNDVTLTDPLPTPPAPSAPTAVADTGSAVIGTAATKAAPGVLANDSGAGGTLSVTAVNGQSANVGKAVAGAYGSLTLAADGSYTYTPDPTKAVYTGSVVDHFTYTDTANGQTATTTLDITVAPPAASTLALFGTVVTSSATQTGSLYGLYEGLLHRAPDAIGLEAFTTALQTGASLTDVAGAILASPEHGPAVSDPTTYVQSLYANALHRAADGGGLSFYTNELNAGVSQATVAVQIATSGEAQGVNAPAFQTGVFVPDAIDSAVARLYYGVLGRAPDANGLAGFEGQVKQAAGGGGGVAGAIQGLAQVANAMISSPEYANAHAGQTDTAFVAGLYQGALGRAPEAAGASFYAQELAQGVSRATVVLQIAESPEAQVHLVGVVEQGFHLAG